MVDEEGAIVEKRGSNKQTCPRLIESGDLSNQQFCRRQ